LELLGLRIKQVSGQLDLTTGQTIEGITGA